MQAHQRRLGATRRRGDHSHRRRTRACRSLLGYGAETGPSRGPQPPNKVRSSHPTLRMPAFPQCAWATVLSAHTRSSLVPIEEHPICTHTHTVGRALRQIACGLGNTKSGIAIVRHDLWFVIYRRSLHSLRRRLCNRSQLYLLHLHRESIGHLQLGDLPPGECRWLTAAEHRLLYTTCLPHTDMPEQAQSALVTDPCERPGAVRHTE